MPQGARDTGDMGPGWKLYLILAVCFLFHVEQYSDQPVDAHGNYQ